MTRRSACDDPIVSECIGPLVSGLCAKGIRPPRRPSTVSKVDAGLDKDSSKPLTVLADMDGTLCDVRSIRNLVEHASDGAPPRKRDFHAFHSASIDCPAHRPVVDLLDEVRALGLSIVIVSAREARWAFLTAIWLREHGVAYDEMFLRDNGDYRRDDEVKADIARSVLRRYAPVLAIDDRPDIIQVWHSFGIPTARVLEDGKLEGHLDPEGVDLRDYVQQLRAGLQR